MVVGNMTLNSSTAQIVSGRYKLLNLLGEGGMGSVYRVYDRLNRQTVALKKVFISKLNSNLDLRMILAQEFQVLASLRHPHIISVLDYGFDDQGQPYFTMDLIENSQTLLNAGRNRPLADKLRLVVQLLHALMYLHRRRILHRDLKPANILVTRDQVKVLDFGMAVTKADIHLLNGDQVVGSLGYLAPEVLTGDRITEATDLYAVGILAYELITGHHPFETTDFMKLLYAPLTSTPDFEALEKVPLPSTPPITPDSATLFLSDATLPQNKEEDLTQVGVIPLIHNLATLVLSDDKSSKNKDHDVTQIGFVMPTTEDAATQIFSDDTLPTRKTQETNPVSSTIPVTSTLRETNFKHQEEEASSSAPMTLSRVMRKLLARDQAQRYQTASQVVKDLEKLPDRSFIVENTSARESFLQAARFIGREREMAQLEKAVEDVLQHVGQLWYISGESGVGKSRIFDELRILALVRGALVLRGQANPHSGPYHIWREPLRRMVLYDGLSETDASLIKIIVNDLDILLERPVAPLPVMDAEDLQKRLFATLHSLLQTQKQPIVLLLEDLHWAGEESLAIIRYLQQNIVNLPVLIIGSYRDDGQFSLPDLGHTIQLQRLNEQEVADLSVAMLGEAAQKADIRNLLHKQTEGNAFFLVEVIRALAEEAGDLDKIGSIQLPENVFTQGVYEVVQRRLARIASDDLPLLRIAAAIGRELELAVLKKISPDLEAWLYRCSSGNILEVQEERWRFSHEKLREGVLENLDPTDKAAIHRQAAEIIEGLYADQPDRAAALAYHWEGAKNPDKQLIYSLKAGEYAYLTSDNTKALAYFQTALLLLDGLKPVDRVGQESKIYLWLAQASLRLGQGEQALDYIQKSLDRAENESVKADAICFRGQVRNRQGEYPDAILDLTQALTIYRALEDQMGATLALTGLGQAYLYQGRLQEGMDSLQAGIKISRDMENVERIGVTLLNLGPLAASMGDFESGQRYLEESLAIFQQLGYRNSMAGALLHLGMTAHMQGQLDQAKTYYQQCEQTFTEIGDLHGLSASLNNQGAIALARLESREAVVYFERSLKISRDAHDQWGTANTLSNMAQVELDLKDYILSQSYLYEAMQIAQSQQATPLALEILFGFGRLWVDTQRGDDAYQLLSFVIRHEATAPDIKEHAEELLQTLSIPDLPASSHEEMVDLEGVVQRIMKQRTE